MLPLGGELKKMLSEVDSNSKSLTKCIDFNVRAKRCGDLCAQVCSLLSFAEASGLRNVARETKALANYLTLLCQTRDALTEVALKKVRRSVEVLHELSRGPGLSESELAQFSSVVLDETSVSRESVSKALVEAGFKVKPFSNAPDALAYLPPIRELVVANLQVPELHGFDLPKIRALPLNEETPVLYLPQLSAADPLAKTEPERTEAPKPLLLAEMVTEALIIVQQSDMPEASEILTRTASQERKRRSLGPPWQSGQMTVRSDSSHPLDH